jgi:hypothetical protein
VAGFWGAKRTPLDRRPKLCGPGAPVARHGGYDGWLSRGVIPGAASHPPQRWLGSGPSRGVDLKNVSTTGGHAEQASNIARGTPEMRRTSGYRKLDDALIARHSAMMPQGFMARRSACGPGVPRARYFLSQGERSKGGARASTTGQRSVGFLPRPACGERSRAQRAGEGELQNGVVPKFPLIPTFSP